MSPRTAAMADKLADKVCTPCRGGIPPLIKGLHENDFIIASRIDQLFGRQVG
jgi:hypothetical protein